MVNAQHTRRMERLLEGEISRYARNPTAVDGVAVLIHRRDTREREREMHGEKLNI